MMMMLNHTGVIFKRMIGAVNKAQRVPIMCPRFISTSALYKLFTYLVEFGESVIGKQSGAVSTFQACFDSRPFWRRGPF